MKYPKYPEIYTVAQFLKIISSLSSLASLDAFVEPKYDGSNIMVFQRRCYTRNLNELPPHFAEGLKKALGDKYDVVMRLSEKYAVFLELGGTANSPAGFSGSWGGEWDYRIFDLFDTSKEAFLTPPEVSEITAKLGLRFVGYRVVKVADVVNNWKEMLKDYSDFEGFVLKVFPPKDILAKIRHHRQFNAILVKFKHEYLGKKPSKPRKASKSKPKLPILPDSEILGVINKAHLQLGEDVRDVRKAMPLIMKLVAEEARKHGNTPPKAGRVYALYRQYLSRTA